MGGMIWDGFSDDALLARTRLVYEAAVTIYEELASTFFPAMRSRLGTATLMPFTLVGSLAPKDAARSPGLTYYLDPTDDGERNEVSITIGVEGDTWETVGYMHDRIQRLRPDVARWARASVISTRLAVFGAGPATALAYRWLSADLKAVGWIERPII